MSRSGRTRCGEVPPSLASGRLQYDPHSSGAVSSNSRPLNLKVRMHLAGVGAVFQQKPFVTQFVRECQSSSDGGLSDTADWAAQLLQKSMSA